MVQQRLWPERCGPREKVEPVVPARKRTEPSSKRPALSFGAQVCTWPSGLEAASSPSEQPGDGLCEQSRLVFILQNKDGHFRGVLFERYLLSSGGSEKGREGDGGGIYLGRSGAGGSFDILRSFFDIKGEGERRTPPSRQSQSVLIVTPSA